MREDYMPHLGGISTKCISCKDKFNQYILNCITPVLVSESEQARAT